MMRFFPLSLIFVSVGMAAQLKTPLDSLLLSVDSLVSQRKNVTLADLKDKGKYRFLYYMPSIGYDFFNHRPMFTYNISDLARMLNDNKKNEYQIRQIENNAALDSELLCKRIAVFYYRLIDLFYLYTIELDIFNFNKELYIFDFKRYKNNEITMEEFFKTEISIREKQKNVLAIRDQLYLNIIELENLTNYSLNYEIQKFAAVGDSAAHIR